jgi:hypothetical protein
MLVLAAAAAAAQMNLCFTKPPPTAGFGRNYAGIHYRSDGIQGNLLGEQIALRFFEERIRSYPRFLHYRGMSLELFNGTRITIGNT